MVILSLVKIVMCRHMCKDNVFNILVNIAIFILIIKVTILITLFYRLVCFPNQLKFPRKALSMMRLPRLPDPPG